MTKNAHYQVTGIHDGQKFEVGRLYNEHFRVFMADAESKKDEALKALKENAKRIIPKDLWKKIVYSSVDVWGARIFSWRFGSRSWVNIDGGRNNFQLHGGSLQ